eukprot:COSAG02_NODE_424_length_22575_cov_79.088361_23_plen_82_part_00
MLRLRVYPCPMGPSIAVPLIGVFHATQFFWYVQYKTRSRHPISTQTYFARVSSYGTTTQTGLPRFSTLVLEPLAVVASVLR